MRSGSSSTRRRVATGRLPRGLAAFAAFLSVALCAAGCASEPTPDPAPEAADGVTGVVVLADDTSDAVAADGGGAIVSIPSAGTGALLDHVGSVLPGRTPPLSELPYVQFALDADLARSWGAEVAEVDDDGRFTLTASGPVVMCRLVDDPAGSYARGCDETTLPATRAGAGEHRGGRTAGARARRRRCGTWWSPRWRDPGGDRSLGRHATPRAGGVAQGPGPDADGPPLSRCVVPQAAPARTAITHTE